MTESEPSDLAAARAAVDDALDLVYRTQLICDDDSTEALKLAEELRASVARLEQWRERRRATTLPEGRPATFRTIAAAWLGELLDSVAASDRARVQELGLSPNHCDGIWAAPLAGAKKAFTKDGAVRVRAQEAVVRAAGLAGLDISRERADRALRSAEANTEKERFTSKVAADLFQVLRVADVRAVLGHHSRIDLGHRHFEWVTKDIERARILTHALLHRAEAAAQRGADAA